MKRIERFQPIEAGNYWKALKDLPESAIYAGKVYLIEKTSYIDGALHTVYIRNHPDLFGEWVNGIKAGSHPFLVAEFVNLFEFEPNGEAIRQAEVDAINRRIVDLQNLPDIELPPAPQLFLPSLESVNDNAIALTKQAIKAQKEAAEKAVAAYTKKANDIQTTVSRLVPYYSEKAAAALARISDTTEAVNRMLSGIKTLDLYLLKNVKVEQIAAGQSAETGFRLTVYQKKIYMDEELCVWADVDVDFDYQDTKTFDKTLASNREFQDQIFGTPRAVVCMAIRRRYKDYGNVWENYGANKLNQEVFLLVRDGENIYKVFSPIESHIGTKMLFPTYDSMGRHFVGLDGSQINLQDVRYVKARKEHDDEALHYKRFLILLAGLDQKGILGQFHPPDTEFISLDFQEKYLHFVSDAMGSNMLPLQRALPVTEWIGEKNKHLRSGSRVFGIWADGFSIATAPSCVKEDRHGNEWVEYRPCEPQSIQIAYASDNQLYVSVPVERSYPERTFNAKIRLQGTHFLCIDAVTEEELAYYIYNRETRSEHLSYIELFKRARKYLIEETARSKDVYDKLAGQVNQDVLNKAIQSYRGFQKGRELCEMSTSEQNEILTHAWWLSKPIEFWTQFQGYVRITIKGTKILAYQPPPNPDNRIFTQKEMSCFELKPSRGGKWKPVSLAPRNIFKHTLEETVLFETNEAENWAVDKADPLSQKEKERLFAEIDAKAELLKKRQLDEETIESLFRRLKRYDFSSKYVDTPDYFIPIGACLVQSQVQLVGFTKLAAAALLEFGGSLRIQDWYSRLYRYPDMGTSRIHNAEWSLSVVPYKAIPHFPFHHYKIREGRGLTEKPKTELPSFNDWIKAAKEKIPSLTLARELDLDLLFQRVPAKGQFNRDDLRLQKDFCNSYALWETPEGDLYISLTIKNNIYYRRVLDMPSQPAEAFKHGIDPVFIITHEDGTTTTTRAKYANININQ